jgi:hypothetical protein
MAFELNYSDRIEIEKTTLNAAITEAVRILDTNPTIERVVITNPAKPELTIIVQQPAPVIV